MSYVNPTMHETPLATFADGAVSEQFKTLISRAYTEDRLWAMSGPPPGESFSGKLKYGNAFLWVNALSRYTGKELFDNPNRLAFGLSLMWLNSQKIDFVFIREERYGNIWGNAWHEIFVLLREAGITSAMIYNDTGEVKGPGIGLIFFSQGDAIMAQALIDEIEFEGRIDFSS